MDVPETVIARADGKLHELAPVAIPAAESTALRAWVVRERARRTIEVGLGYAVSSMAITQGLAEVGDSDLRHGRSSRISRRDSPTAASSS